MLSKKIAIYYHFYLIIKVINFQRNAFQMTNKSVRTLRFKVQDFKFYFPKHKLFNKQNFKYCTGFVLFILHDKYTNSKQVHIYNKNNSNENTVLFNQDRIFQAVKRDKIAFQQAKVTDPRTKIMTSFPHEHFVGPSFFILSFQELRYSYNVQNTKLKSLICRFYGGNPNLVICTKNLKDKIFCSLICGCRAPSSPENPHSQLYNI